MVDKLVDYKIELSKDIAKYSFNLDGNDYTFDVVNFNGIDEYNSLLEDGEESIFKKADKVKHKVFKVAGYDWDLEKTNPNVDIFKLIRIIEWVGKDYIMRFWPDIIFYETDDLRLHMIYKRMFDTAGYDFLYGVGNSYIYLRNFGSPVEIS